MKKNWQIFSQPRVYLYILTGALIILFTFFTQNNALEIAISGVASVFIGIGVNNFSAIETRQKDEEKLNAALYHTSGLMKAISLRLERMHTGLTAEEGLKYDHDFSELEYLVELAMRHIGQEER
ncbi:MAG TPA: OST5 family protein [Chitinophagaceae bacterium]|nr:OST5 family protein [Chitinophagaceae bacterium]